MYEIIFLRVKYALYNDFTVHGSSNLDSPVQSFTNIRQFFCLKYSFLNAFVRSLNNYWKEFLKIIKAAIRKVFWE